MAGASTPLFRAIFPSAESAQGFITNLLESPTNTAPNRPTSTSAELGASAIYPNITSTRTHPFWTNLTLNASRNGGQLLHSSSYRESYVYNYQSFIGSQDYHYLLQRDPTASLIVRWPAEDTWAAPPRVPSSVPIDEALDELTLLGFPQAAISADVYRALDGFSFIYIVASSPPDQPIQRGDTVYGFEVITAAHLPLNTKLNNSSQTAKSTPRSLDDAIVYDTTGDPSTPYHRISSLKYFPDPSQTSSAEDEVTVHGSRLIPLFDDPRARTPLQAQPDMLALFDDLQNLRDIVYAQTRGIMEGNPIVVEVDTDNDYSLETDEEVDAITEELETFVRGSSQSFSPLEGLTMKRLGPSDLGDTGTAIRTLASRISHSTRIPVNMILASSRGSEQVTDEDFITYASVINARRQRIALPVYNYLAQVFKLASPSTNPRSTPLVPLRARFPARDLEWPSLRVLNEKDEMLVRKNEAQAIMFALMSGYKPIPNSRVTRNFEENTTPIDPKFILPRQPNWIIQDVDEEWDGPSGGNAGVIDSESGSPDSPGSTGAPPG